MSEHVFGLRDAELWSAQRSDIEDAQARLIERDEERLVLDAPSVVDLQVRTTLPTWVSYVGPLNTISSVVVKELICVVASNVDTREVRVAINLAAPRGTSAPVAMQRSSRQVASAVRRALVEY